MPSSGTSRQAPEAGFLLSRSGGPELDQALCLRTEAIGNFIGTASKKMQLKLAQRDGVPERLRRNAKYGHGGHHPSAAATPPKRIVANRCTFLSGEDVTSNQDRCCRYFIQLPDVEQAEVAPELMCTELKARSDATQYVCRGERGFPL